jgi:hypothetical protein
MDNLSLSEEKEQSLWATVISKSIALPVWVCTYVLKFGKRIVFTDEMRTERQIKNLRDYLDALALLVKQMENSGASKREIRDMLERLGAPAAEATLKGILLSQALSNAEALKAVNNIELAGVGGRISGEAVRKLENK